MPSDPGAAWGVAMSHGTRVDFVVVACQEEGRWRVTPLPPRLAADLTMLLTVLRQQPSEKGTVGLVSVNDDYFVAVRTAGHEVRLLLSDVTAAEESPLAREVLDTLDLRLPEGDDIGHIQPAGDLTMFADFGMSAPDLGALCVEAALYPEEMLSDIALRLGFGDQFDWAVEAAVR